MVSQVEQDVTALKGIFSASAAHRLDSSQEALAGLDKFLSHFPDGIAAGRILALMEKLKDENLNLPGEVKKILFGETGWGPEADAVVDLFTTDVVEELERAAEHSTMVQKDDLVKALARIGNALIDKTDPNVTLEGNAKALLDKHLGRFSDPDGELARGVARLINYTVAERQTTAATYDPGGSAMRHHPLLLATP